MNTTPIPNILRDLRIKAELRQLDVACALGFKNTDRISLWENGLAYPSVPNLLQLAKLFGVHAEDMYPV